MISPVKELPQTLYLASTSKPVGALLAHEVNGVERLAYYLSRSLQKAEMNYLSIESQRLALIFATHKLCHYFLAHLLNLVTKSNPLWYLV